MAVFKELAHYLRRHRKLVLLPLILVFLLFGVLLVIAEVAPVVSPFIYTLF